MVKMINGKPPEEKKAKTPLKGYIALIAIAVIGIVIGIVVWAPWETNQAPTTQPQLSPPNTEFLTWETNQDTEFLTWVTETSDLMADDFDAYVSVLDSGNMSLIAAIALSLYIDADNALSEIDSYQVSEELAPCKNEFKLALQDVKEAGWLMRQWALYGNLDDLDQAISYLDSGIIHLGNTVDLLPD